GVVEVLAAPLKAVVQDHKTIRRVSTTNGQEYAAQVFVDATYEGDLMAAADVPWTLGREGRNEFGESLAGQQYPKPAMAISAMDAGGHTLPLITGRFDETADAEGDRNVMTYSFRLCVTSDPNNRVP